MARNIKKLNRGNKGTESVKTYTDFNTYVIDLIASEYGWTYEYIENLKFSKGLKLMLAIKERSKFKMVKEINILGTALLDGKVRKEIIDDILDKADNGLENIINTDFNALDRLKQNME